MDFRRIALGIGLLLVGILCTYGAIDQVLRGETWGPRSGKSRAIRGEDPGYFWFLFFIRILFGPVLIVSGIITIW